MRAFYSRIYPHASEHVHFSLTAAVDGLRDVEQVELDGPQWKAAAEALSLALLVFGFFLEASESLIGHGLTERVGRIVDELLDT